jgi:hypothetical protein
VTCLTARQVFVHLHVVMRSTPALDAEAAEPDRTRRAHRVTDRSPLAKTEAAPVHDEDEQQGDRYSTKGCF